MSEVHLWRAVIAQAINDTIGADVRPNDQHHARAWFDCRNADFAEVCALAGLEPEAVRAQALIMIEEHAHSAARGVSSRGIALHPCSPRKRGVIPLRIEVEGLNLTIAEWATHSGISQRLIKTRLYRGWSGERAVTEPARQSCVDQQDKH